MCCVQELAALKQRNIKPKYIYHHPDCADPTGTIMRRSAGARCSSLQLNMGVPDLRDDCYADLDLERQRPPAIHRLSDSSNVIHVGSFSKSIAPRCASATSWRPGYPLARARAQDRRRHRCAEQMVLAEFCAPQFATMCRGCGAGCAPSSRP